MLLGLVIYVALRDKYLPGIGVRADEADSRRRGADRIATDKKALVHGIIGAAAGSW